ncbi:MAG: hypothetical protein HC796_07880, partial [Synechococcaceae cyanobacterium RL_1_2]|nr:hypothetical protein [Synechococcaceae cyanobacterium RL_1_2]
NDSPRSLRYDPLALSTIAIVGIFITFSSGMAIGLAIDAEPFINFESTTNNCEVK